MTDEQKCTCKGVLGHSRQCALFDESMMEGLQRKALAMGDDPGVLGGAAGASEGQAEPVAEIVDVGDGIGTTFIEFIVDRNQFPVGTKFYTHPSAEIAALRERIAGMEKDAERYRYCAANWVDLGSWRDEDVDAAIAKEKNNAK